MRTSHRRTNKNRKTPKWLTFLQETTPPYFRRHHASGHVTKDCAFSVWWDTQPDVASDLRWKIRGTSFRSQIFLSTFPSKSTWKIWRKAHLRRKPFGGEGESRRVIFACELEWLQRFLGINEVEEKGRGEERNEKKQRVNRKRNEPIHCWSQPHPASTPYLFETKIAKTNTLFLPCEQLVSPTAKTANWTIPFGNAHTYIAHIRKYPRVAT